MFTLRKFYNAGVADAGGGAETEVLDKPEVKDAAVIEEKKEEKPSLVEAMAKGGTRILNGEQIKTDKKGETPIVNTEKKEEPKLTATEEKQVETTAPTDAAPEAKPETPKQEVKETLAEKLPIAEQSKPLEKSLQEVLKSQQPDNVLKELGFDDEMVDIINDVKDYKDKKFFKGFLQSLKDGNANEYLREWNTDYSKMSAEDVMRHQLRLEYPKASEKALDALYEDEIVNRYNLDSDDTVLSEKGKLLLEAKADKYRDSLIENQQSKLAPKPPEPKTPVVDNTAAEKAQQEFEAYKNKISSDPYYKELTTSNEFVLGKGADKFTYPVNSKELSDVIFDGEQWSKSLLKPAEDGSKEFVPDVEKQLLIGIVAKYGTNFLDEIAKHFKSRGGKAVTDSIENARVKENQTLSNTEAKSESLAEEMGKKGRLVTGAS